VDIYLANAGTSSQGLPVPKFYWKLLIDEQTQRGVVFVGINDPYVAIPYPKDYVICTDILSKITWLKLSDSKWLYACEVEEFVKLSQSLPQVKVSGLLDK